MFQATLITVGTESGTSYRNGLTVEQARSFAKGLIANAEVTFIEVVMTGAPGTGTVPGTHTWNRGQGWS